jgi:hypothetical protein
VQTDKADAIIIEYDISRKQPPDILSDYRQWRSRQEERIGTHSDDCHMWPRHERCMIHRLAREVERLRQGLSQKNDCPAPDNAAAQDILTDEERAALEYFSKWGTWSSAAVHAATLLALLARTERTPKATER